MTAGRSLTTDLRAALTAAGVQICHLVKMAFDSGTVAIWTGRGDLAFGSDTYQGHGGNLKFAFPSETVEQRAASGTIVLGGLDPSILAIADTENYQGRRITIYTGAFNLTTGALIADPTIEFRGVMVAMEPEDSGETATITLGVTSRAALFDRPSNRRYTPEDQALRDSTDKGFDYVAGLQDKTITWGHP